MGKIFLSAVRTEALMTVNIFFMQILFVYPTKQMKFVWEFRLHLVVLNAFFKFSVRSYICFLWDRKRFYFFFYIFRSQVIFFNVKLVKTGFNYTIELGYVMTRTPLHDRKTLKIFSLDFCFFELHEASVNIIELITSISIKDSTYAAK